MKRNDFERLVQASWRRALTPAEQQELADWLEAHPESRPEWAEEVTLNRTLAALPDAPLSPGFTTRAVSAAARLGTQERRSVFAWPGRLPAMGGLGRWATVGVAALALAVGAVVYERRQAHQRMAESLAAMSVLAELPNFEALADFEVVLHLPTGPLPDDQELAEAFR
jgi:anti-sigma factor RsiW